MTQVERIKRMERYLEESSKAIEKMQEALVDYEKIQTEFRKLCEEER